MFFTVDWTNILTQKKHSSWADSSFCCSRMKIEQAQQECKSSVTHVQRERERERQRDRERERRREGQKSVSVTDQEPMHEVPTSTESNFGIYKHSKDFLSYGELATLLVLLGVVYSWAIPLPNVVLKKRFGPPMSSKRGKNRWFPKIWLFCASKRTHI